MKSQQNRFLSVGLTNLAVIVLLFISSSSMATGAVDNKMLSSERMVAGLDFARNVVEMDSILDEREINNLRRAYETARLQLGSSLDSATYAIILNQFLATLKDGHTFVVDKGARRGLSLKITWLESGPVVTEAGQSLLSGDRILAMGGWTTSRIFAELSKVIPSENRFHVRALAPEVMVSEGFLRWIGVLDKSGGVTIDFERDGTVGKIYLKVLGKPAVASSPKWYDFKFESQNSLGIIGIDSCQYDDNFAAALEGFIADANRMGIQKLAIDLRLNPGGDSLTAFAVAAYLSDHFGSFGVQLRKSDDLLSQAPAFAPVFISQYKVPGSIDLYDLPAEAVKPGSMARLGSRADIGPAERFRGKVFLLTSNVTFSSANLFATMFRDNHLSLLVGEPTGNEVNFHGQMITLEMPGLPIQLNASTSRNFRPNSKLPNAGTLLPNVHISRTREDIRLNRDKSLDWIRRFDAD